MTKRARAEHPIHELIASRWSPYAFSDRPVARADLCSLFEAARWAASSYNEQPWSYVLATRDDAEEFERLLQCLVEGNRRWARAGGALALSILRRRFEGRDAPNPAAPHDLGFAAAALSFEATARGLFVHHMIGIDPDRARETYAIPDGHDAYTAMAIGHRADPGTSPPRYLERDERPRTRKPLHQLVFRGRFGAASPLVKP